MVVLEDVVRVDSTGAQVTRDLKKVGNRCARECLGRSLFSSDVLCRPPLPLSNIVPVRVDEHALSLVEDAHAQNAKMR